MSHPIWLVRHGEASATWGEHPDPGLSALGQQQAVVAAESLIATLPGDVQLISSPKQRALETAMPLAERLQRPVRIDAAFTEVVSPAPLAERQDWLKSFMRQTWREQSPPILSWREGIIEGLLSLEQPTVIFSHFLVINTVVAYVREHQDTLQFWPDNGSVHEFGLDFQGNLRLVKLGEEMATRIN